MIGRAHGQDAVLQHLELARVADAAAEPPGAGAVAHHLERAHAQRIFALDDLHRRAGVKWHIAMTMGVPSCVLVPPSEVFSSS